jgi:hypothetical protein
MRRLGIHFGRDTDAFRANGKIAKTGENGRFRVILPLFLANICQQEMGFQIDASDLI